MPFFAFFRQPAKFQKQTKQKFGVKFETYFQASLESGVFFYKFKLLVFTVFSIQQQRNRYPKGVTE